MSAKLILFVCFAVFAVAFALPSGPVKEESKENMKTAETLHLPFSINIGGIHPHHPYGYHRGFGFDFSLGHHYDPYYDYYHHYHPHHY